MHSWGAGERQLVLLAAAGAAALPTAHHHHSAGRRCAEQQLAVLTAACAHPGREAHAASHAPTTACRVEQGRQDQRIVRACSACAVVAAAAAALRQLRGAGHCAGLPALQGLHRWGRGRVLGAGAGGRRSPGRWRAAGGGAPAARAARFGSPWRPRGAPPGHHQTAERGPGRSSSSSFGASARHWLACIHGWHGIDVGSARRSRGCEGCRGAAKESKSCLVLRERSSWAIAIACPSAGWRDGAWKEGGQPVAARTPRFVLRLGVPLCHHTVPAGAMPPRLDLKPAAHRAARTVEQQGGLLECRCPANNIVREFLL